MLFRILVALLLGVCSAQAVIIDRTLAIVNQDVITESELRAIEQLALEIDVHPQRETTLERRIDHVLILQELQNQPPVRVSEEDVQRVVDSYVRKYGGTEELMLFLTFIGMNFADFENEIRDSLSIREFIRARFRPFVAIGIPEAEAYYEKVYKPKQQSLGREVLPFTEAFDEIQVLLAEEEVQKRTLEWLQELRARATISIKQ